MSRIQPWNRVWHVGLRWILSTLLMGSVWAASDFDQARKAYEQGNQEEAVAGFERRPDGYGDRGWHVQLHHHRDRQLDGHRCAVHGQPGLFVHRGGADDHRLTYDFAEWRGGYRL